MWKTEVNMGFRLDPEKIQYESPEERDRFERRNKEFCSKINKGGPLAYFAIVFSQPLEEDGQVCVTSKYNQGGDLYYALVVLGDGSISSVMPYPIFEQAMDRFFKEEEIRAFWDDDDQDILYASEEEFIQWLEEVTPVGGQVDGSYFCGLAMSFSGSKEDRIAAIKFAQELARPFNGCNYSHQEEQIQYLLKVIESLSRSNYGFIRNGIVGRLVHKVNLLDTKWWLRECRIVSTKEYHNCDLIIEFAAGYFNDNGDRRPPTYLVVTGLRAEFVDQTDKLPVPRTYCVFNIPFITKGMINAEDWKSVERINKHFHPEF